MGAHAAMGMSDAMGMFAWTVVENGAVPKNKTRVIQA
jgi:hypothetical protein